MKTTKLLILFTLLWTISYSQLINDTLEIHNIPIVHWDGVGQVPFIQGRQAIYNDSVNSLFPPSTWYSATLGIFEPVSNHNFEVGDLIYIFSNDILCGIGKWQITGGNGVECIVSVIYGHHDYYPFLPSTGDSIEFVLYNQSMNLDAQYITGDLSVTNYYNQPYYYGDNYIYVIDTILFPQVVPIRHGWSSFSTYVDQTGKPLSDIIDINSVFIKNGQGEVYCPYYSLDMIGSIENKKGYQIKTLQADTLIFYGKALFDFDIELSQGWNLIGVPGWWSRSTMSLFDSDLMIIKDDYGLFTWPEYYVNYMPQLQPGKSYWCKMYNSTTINY